MPFLRACLFEASAAGLLIFFRPGYRYFFFSFSTVALSRFPSLFTGITSHNTLLPPLLGASAGLFFRFLFLRKDAGTGEKNESSCWIFSLFLFFAFLLVRAFLEYYSPWVFLGYPVRDLEVSSGISANYAMHLAASLDLNFLGPLAFLFMDRLFEQDENAAKKLLQGFAAGILCAMFFFALQEAGIRRAFLGIADKGMEALRWPMLFSDSGSASVLFVPFAFTGILLCFEKYKSPPLRLAAVVLLGVVCAFVSFRSGRNFFLSLAGVAIVVFLTQFQTGTYLRSLSKIRLIAGTVLSLTLSLGLFAFLLRSPAGEKLQNSAPLFFQDVKEGRFLEAYADLDAPRAVMHRLGYEIFKKYPLTGGGINSFVAESAAVKIEGGIPFQDNPASLWMGILSDLGLVGFFIFALTVIVYFYNIYFERPPLFALLPLALFPAFFFGEHTLAPECAAFLFFPFFVLRQSSGFFSALFGILGVLYFALWLLFWPIEPPAFWRHSHGVRGQTASDQVIPGECGNLYVYRNRASFVTESPMDTASNLFLLRTGCFDSGVNRLENSACPEGKSWIEIERKDRNEFQVPAFCFVSGVANKSCLDALFTGKKICPSH